MGDAVSKNRGTAPEEDLKLASGFHKDTVGQVRSELENRGDTALSLLVTALSQVTSQALHISSTHLMRALVFPRGKTREREP